MSRGELRWTLPLLVVFHNLQQSERNIFHVFVMSFISSVTFIFLFNSYSVLLPYSDSVYFCFRYFYLFFMHFLWHFYRKRILKAKITFLNVLSIRSWYTYMTRMLHIYEKQKNFLTMNITSWITSSILVTVWLLCTHLLPRNFLVITTFQTWNCIFHFRIHPCLDILNSNFLLYSPNST